MVNLRHPLSLWDLSRKLHLGMGSTAALFKAYYFGRRAWLQKMVNGSVIVNLPEYGKVPLRVNGYDHKLLSLIFIRQDYKFEASNVRRILDLGANIGMATLYLHRLFPQAVFACVEASPQNWPFLKQTVELNKIEGRIFEAAIGPVEGSIDLYLSSNPDCHSVIPGLQSKSGGIVTVPLITVPRVMEQMGWDSIDVLKIDIEGAEKYVLGQNNNWLHKVRIITGESHVDVGYSYAQLIDDLAAYGFEVKTVIEEKAASGASFVATNKNLKPATVHGMTASV